MKKLCLVIFCSFSCLTAIAFVLFNYVIFPTKYKNYVVKYSEEFGLDKAMVYAIIKAESDFDKNAVSKSGAKGLMQIIPSTADWIATELDVSQYNLFDEETNIKFGCFYLKYLYKKFDNRNTVICAYNAGEGAVKTWLDDNGDIDESKIDFDETKEYLKRVNSNFRVYKLHFVAI